MVDFSDLGAIPEEEVKKPSSPGLDFSDLGAISDQPSVSMPEESLNYAKEVAGDTGLGIAQGITLGGADELEGALKAMATGTQNPFSEDFKKNYRKWQELSEKKYKEALSNLDNVSNVGNKYTSEKISGVYENQRKLGINKEIELEILRKLDIFEKNIGYIKKGLTLKTLATQFETNTYYLSWVINENKKVNFNKYLSDLRINYITNQLFTHKKYLNYTIEALAEECGIASRQNFSDLFYEINALRPTDFIKQRIQEMKNT